ncbi:hypothetical protein [Pararhodospirillum photometricum]|nr:hypothetical protein [Pararhodospirillum photometricum]
MSNTPHPCEALDDIKSVASFVALTMTFDEIETGMTPEDRRGLYKILSWMRDCIADTEENVRHRMTTMEVDTLKRVGLPLEALADERMKKTWRDGFSHGVKYSGTE